jgi:hypothetical protein
MKNSNKTTVLTIVVSLLVVFVLVMSGPEGSIINSSYVYAAKSSGGGSGGSSGSGGGGGSKGGSSGGSSSSSTSSSSSDTGSKGSSDSGSSSSSSGGTSGTTGGDSKGSGDSKSDSGNTGVSGRMGGIDPIKHPGITISKPIVPDKGDNGLNPDGRNTDGGVMIDPGHSDFCKTHPGKCNHDGGDGHFCLSFPCHFPRDHHHDVKVIHKTVVVHDRNNAQQTIIVNANAAGTCFVTQTQIVSIPGLVAQLLDQCTSVTIIRG